MEGEHGGLSGVGVALRRGVMRVMKSNATHEHVVTCGCSTVFAFIPHDVIPLAGLSSALGVRCPVCERIHIVARIRVESDASEAPHIGSF